MRIRLIRKYLAIVCLLATSLYANLVFAGWSDDPSQGYSSQRFGAFPPLDIDQRLQDNLSAQENMITGEQAEESQSQYNSVSDSDNRYQSDSYPEQEYSAQKSQQPNNLNYDQGRSVSSRSGNPQKKRSHSTRKKKRGSSFGAPWNSKGSGFSAPWNNRRPGFSAPWDNNGSGFNAPWDNNGSGFSGPWDNNGSSFSFPFGNNGSGFSPWGNRRGR